MAVVIDGTLTNPDFPRICYNNLSASATISSSSEATGFDMENVQNALTWNFWKPTSQDSYLQYDFGGATSLNYIGIAAHNCGTQGNTVNIQYYDAAASPAAWVTIDTHVPSDDSPILFLFNSVSYQNFKINFTGGSVPSVGVVFMGTQLVSQRGIYGGHTPITLAEKNVIRPNRSEGGQWLGRSVIRQGASTNIEIKNMTAAWVRSNLEPFIEDAVNNPFFFAWSPTSYPAEVGYCWTSGDIKPVNNGQADLMDVSFSVSARLD